MSKALEALAHFQIATQLLGVIRNDSDKVKFLQVRIDGQDYAIKLPKTLRKQLDFELSVGSWVYIQGIQELDRKKGVLRLTAFRIQPLLPPEELWGESIIPQHQMTQHKQQKASILICQKSDCWKRGGKAVCQQLETALRDRGLADQVEIKTTGCMKQCKQGPNIVFMPNKARYRQVSPQQAVSLLDRHFPKTEQTVKTTQGEFCYNS
ncbi:MAG: (2Fe-2S) ferredoxin domain-containing protein [Snowella sp.]|nr:(2Fe-2S) ferredoxin domain-containing protein [Snowella sp.]